MTYGNIHCGSQPLNMVPIYPCLLVFAPFQAALHILLGLVCVTNRIWDIMICYFWDQTLKDTVASFCTFDLSLSLSCALGKASFHVMGSPVERSTRQGTDTLFLSYRFIPACRSWQVHKVIHCSIALISKDWKHSICIDINQQGIK